MGVGVETVPGLIHTKDSSRPSGTPSVRGMQATRKGQIPSVHVLTGPKNANLFNFHQSIPFCFCFRRDSPLHLCFRDLPSPTPADQCESHRLLRYSCPSDHYDLYLFLLVIGNSIVGNKCRVLKYREKMEGGDLVTFGGGAGRKDRKLG